MYVAHVCGEKDLFLTWIGFADENAVCLTYIRWIITHVVLICDVLCYFFSNSFRLSRMNTFMVCKCLEQQIMNNDTFLITKLSYSSNKEW